MTKKVFVTGFPHSGTTILRGIIGKCDSVFDQHKEFGDPSNYNPNSPYDFFVWKHPFLPTVFRNNGYSVKPNSSFSDTTIIQIIRNPWYTFTSLYKRSLEFNEFSIFDNKNGHSFAYWQNAAQRFLEAEENKYKDVYVIRYEDMFDNNFEKLKLIFDSIGLKYTNEVFQNNKIIKHNNSHYIEDYDKTGDIGEPYRTWQINQPFQNMNKVVSIPDKFSEILSNSELVKQIGYTKPI